MSSATSSVPRKSSIKRDDAVEGSGRGDESAGAADDGAQQKEVCFGDLVIFEFPNMLGDNPGVSEGAPLTIGWKHEAKNVVAVDYYEFLRQSGNKPRRRRKELVMSSTARDT